MKDNFYSTAHGFIAICAVNDLKSVEEMVSLVEHVLTTKDFKTIALVVGVNKMDLDEQEHVVTHGHVKKALKEIGMTNFSIFNTSAKTGENIRPMIEEMIRRSQCSSHKAFEILQQIIAMDSAALKDELPKKDCSVM